MKKYISIFLSILVLCSAFFGSSLVTSAGTDDDLSVLEYEVIDSNTAKITKYDSLSSEFDIPSEIDGYTITAIGDKAFYSCHNLKKVTIPNTVTSIGKRAFDTCQKLTTVLLPDSLTSIEYRAFADCKMLSSIDIPNGVTTIGNNAFIRCQNMTSAFIPDTITYIGNYAFSDCVNLKNLTIGNGEISIGEYAFGWNLSLENIVLGDKTKEISDYAFYACDSLKSITIKSPQCIIYDSINTIADNATIYGYADSTAHSYATKYERDFVALDEKPTQPSVEYKLGDTDLDGIITVVDATHIQRALALLEELSSVQQQVADTDRNGFISIVDATKIQMYVAEIITEL